MAKAFQISVEMDNINLDYRVEQIFAGKRVERFRISGKDKSIIIKSDRPRIRAKKMFTESPKWELQSTELRQKGFFNKLVNALEVHFEQRGYPSKNRKKSTKAIGLKKRR